MTFTSPWWLAVGLVVVVALAWLAVTTTRRRREALAAAGVSATSRTRVPAGAWLGIGGIALAALAVGGPSAKVPVARAAGTLIVAVDVSNSMTADDVSPSRLAAAKKAATDLIDAQPRSVDVGVVAFQDDGLTTYRPSADHAAAIAAVERLKTTGGTSLAEAILTSLAAVTGKPVTLDQDGSPPTDLGYWPSATIVLLSDGQDQSSDDTRTQAAATAAQNAGVHVETVGVGTTAGTTVDVDGYRMQTALDEDTLTAIAKTTGGSYHPASTAHELGGVASGIDLRLTVHKEPTPLAGVFAGGALLLLALGAALTVLRTGRLV